MSLSGDMRVFRHGCPKKAVYHHSTLGPCFYQALALGSGKDMRSGRCITNNHEGEDGQFNIPVDEHGNCVLTGEGKGLPDGEKDFTATGIEVFLVE